MLLRVRGPRRLLGLLLVGFAAASHAAYNHATIITPRPRTVDALFWPPDQVNHVLWLVPLLCLGLATWLDLGRIRQGKAEHAGVAAEGERSAGLGLWSYATLRPPWTTLVTLHFLRVRRALYYTRSTTEAAPLLEAVRELRRRIDQTRNPDAWRDRSRPPLVPPTRRLVPVAIWLLLIAPGALYLLIGGWPGTAGLQKFLSSPHVFPVLAALTAAGVAWSLWRLLSMLRSVPAAVALPYAEPAARLQLQAIAGGSAILISGASLYKWFTGTAPTARVVENLHILQAQWPLIIGLSIAIFGLILFPPAGWFATISLAEGATATVLTTEGLSGLVTEGAAVAMMAHAAQGGGGGDSTQTQSGTDTQGTAQPQPPSSGVGPKPPAQPPTVSDSKLGNIVNDLYKGTNNPNRVGDGTTMDAIRNELSTGQQTAGKMHIMKGQEYSNALTKWLSRNPNASAADRTVAQDLLQDLQDALAGKP